MATQYQILIQMSAQTVQALQQNGFTLFGFKAVQSTAHGMPTVWLATGQIGMNVAVSWTEEYQAYVSLTSVMAGAQVIASAEYDIDLGQTLTITNATGIGTVTQGGSQGAVCIANQTTTQFTSGIAQGANGSSSPTCAFPLFGQNAELIVPLEQVALIFSTQSANPGTIVQQSHGPGIVIDMTGASQRTVTFDINQGWSAGGAVWAQPFPGNTDLVPLLIQHSPQLSAMKAALDLTAESAS